MVINLISDQGVTKTPATVPVVVGASPRLRRRRYSRLQEFLGGPIEHQRRVHRAGGHDEFVGGQRSNAGAGD